MCTPAGVHNKCTFFGGVYMLGCFVDFCRMLNDNMSLFFSDVFSLFPLLIYSACLITFFICLIRYIRNSGGERSKEKSDKSCDD